MDTTLIRQAIVLPHSTAAPLNTFYPSCGLDQRLIPSSNGIYSPHRGIKRSLFAPKDKLTRYRRRRNKQSVMGDRG